MERITEKAYFLRNEYINKVRSIPNDAQPKWGKMNLQQMIEHMAEFMHLGAGHIPQQIHTPEEQIEAYQNFLRSEKPFRENTPNATLPDEPRPLRYSSIEEAIDNLSNEIKSLFKAFEDDCDKIVVNPIFGKLNYEMSIQLLHKHAWHHLRQFGITE
jgi:hypothetical protein